MPAASCRKLTVPWSSLNAGSEGELINDALSCS